MFDVVDVGKLQYFDMASKKPKKGKDPVIEVSSNRKEEIEGDVGAPRPIYNNMRC